MKYQMRLLIVALSLLPITVFHAEWVTETFELYEGVNMIGFPLITNQTIPVLFAPLVEQGVLVRVADDNGKYYLPQENFSNLPFHTPTHAYAVIVTADCRLQIRGISLHPNFPVRLRRGFNILVYFPQEPLRLQRGNLQFLPPELIIMKDELGNFCIPSREISNIGLIRRGDILWVNVTQNCTLVWPER